MIGPGGVFKFPKPAPRREPLKPGQNRRTRMKPKRARRVDRKDRQVLVNDFDGRGPRIETKAGHDEARLAWIRGETCEVRRIEYAPGYFRVMTTAQAGCRGRIEAAHEGEKKAGLAMKSSDAKSIALCRAHHRFWTGTVGKQGPFEGWSKEKRNEWAQRRGAESEARYLAHGSRRGA